MIGGARQRGHAAADRELCVPRSWTDDPDGCRAAGRPEPNVFATKPDLARQMSVPSDRSATRKTPGRVRVCPWFSSRSPCTGHGAGGCRINRGWRGDRRRRPATR
ncbi:transposase [Streptomyces sp. NPDC051664]|uniref:transposase n=1 Tax=Streptomyces sp. NPDC051664 TaxID=3365668 RepID=UPI003799EE7A